MCSTEAEQEVEAEQEGLLPILGPKRVPGILGAHCSNGGCTSGVLSYSARLRPGHDTARGAGGYRLAVRILDTEGETDASASPQMQDGCEWPGADVKEENTRFELQQQRRDAVLVGFSRVAFLTCDVLVIVTTESLASSRLYRRLLEWAQVTSAS